MRPFVLVKFYLACRVAFPVRGVLLARLHPGRLARHLRVVRRVGQLPPAALLGVQVEQRLRSQATSSMPACTSPRSANRSGTVNRLKSGGVARPRRARPTPSAWTPARRAWAAGCRPRRWCGPGRSGCSRRRSRRRAPPSTSWWSPRRYGAPARVRTRWRRAGRRRTPTAARSGRRRARRGCPRSSGSPTMPRSSSSCAGDTGHPDRVVEAGAAVRVEVDAQLVGVVGRGRAVPARGGRSACPSAPPRPAPRPRSGRSRRRCGRRGR